MSPDQSELLARVAATDVAGLRSAVRVLRRVAGEYDRVAGRMNGVTAAASNYWQAGSQKSFNSYATRLTGDLSDAAAAMRAMAVALDGHAAATEEAQGRLRAAAGLATAGKYATNQTADDSREQRWALQATEDFHTSEQRVRARLWQLGTDAPGGIPLPTLPPQPHQNWWQAELFPSAFGAQQCLDQGGGPHSGNPSRYDPRHPLFGFDEDGKRVPAYEADPMAQHQVQDGLPLRGIFELLRVDGASINTAAEAEAAAGRIITQSTKWASGGMRKHVREFFRLPGHGNEPVPAWAEEEYLRLLTRSAAESKRVFEWDTRKFPTWAYLYTDQDTKQMLVVQFYRSGTRTSQLATAFVPNPRELQAMLEARAVTK